MATMVITDIMATTVTMDIMVTMVTTKDGNITWKMLPKTNNGDK